MGINIAAKKDYVNAIRNLFPKGEYWGKQIADPESDLNLFCEAKAQEIIKYRERMRDLFSESGYKTAVETISDWERVLLGYVNNHLPLEERRNILSTKNNSVINRIVIAAIAKEHGLMLLDIVFPFKPSFFGFSEFGRSIFSRPAFYSVFYIITKFQNEELRTEAGECVAKLMKNSLFGQARFGTGQFLGRSYFINDYSNSIFSGMKKLYDFEQSVNSNLIASNIVYYLYKF